MLDEREPSGSDLERIDMAVSNGAKVVEVRLGWREQVAERQKAGAA